MISCKGEYITKLEHFRDLVDDEVYEALEKFVKNKYKSKIDYLENKIIEYEEECDEME